VELLASEAKPIERLVLLKVKEYKLQVKSNYILIKSAFRFYSVNC